MRMYGSWAGRRDGVPEDKTRCVASVPSQWITAQCSRKRGHGMDGLYCKQHAKMLADGLHLHVPADAETTEDMEEGEK